MHQTNRQPNKANLYFRTATPQTPNSLTKTFTSVLFKVRRPKHPDRHTSIISFIALLIRKELARPLGISQACNRSFSTCVRADENSSRGSRGSASPGAFRKCAMLPAVITGDGTPRHFIEEKTRSAPAYVETFHVKSLMGCKEVRQKAFCV